MPSSTFFNLPPEKRQKFLRSARAEFARVPFAEASINKIIRSAGIPRGSFYMYFADKNELFLYLMGSYSEELETCFATLLDQLKGDLSAAFLALYDFIQAEYRNSPPGSAISELMSIVRLNRQMQPQIFLKKERVPPDLRPIRERVDESLLDLRAERDFEDIFHLLVGAVGAAILQGTLAEDPDTVRARLANTLDILARGTVKKTAGAGPAGTATQNLKPTGGETFFEN